MPIDRQSVLISLWPSPPNKVSGLSSCLRHAPFCSSTRAEVPVTYCTDQSRDEQSTKHRLKKPIPELDMYATIDFVEEVLRISQRELNRLLPGDNARDRAFERAFRLNKQRLLFLTRCDSLDAKVEPECDIKPEYDQAATHESKENMAPYANDSNTATPSESSSAKLEKTVLCNGKTKKGTQCKRRIAKQSLSEKRFCYQHRDQESRDIEALKQDGKGIVFSEWIPAYLRPDTRAKLRFNMEKARSPEDEPGYIYVFEIIDPKSSKFKIKVGRSTNPLKRVCQWSNQCSSNEHPLLGIYPRPQEVSNLKGLIKLGEPASLSHRLERLIHLELADLAASEAYLDPNWPASIASSTSALGTHTYGFSDLRDTTSLRGMSPCSDCGKIHLEIFEFTRIKEGKMKGKEWECIILPVIEKWGAFVEKYV